MIRQNELMNVRCSERGSLQGIKIYSPSSECLIECVDIPEHGQNNLDHIGKSTSVLINLLVHKTTSRVFIIIF